MVAMVATVGWLWRDDVGSGKIDVGSGSNGVDCDW
jgi:hypothetical protein